MKNEKYTEDGELNGKNKTERAEEINKQKKKRKAI